MYRSRHWNLEYLLVRRIVLKCAIEYPAFIPGIHIEDSSLTMAMGDLLSVGWSM